jgi:hypothetical protein
MSILERGLVYFPNQKKVFGHLVGGLAEPQCQGMICLTDLPFEIGGRHRDMYGNYGVALNREWAIKNGACKVIYVGKTGSVVEAFSSLFAALEPAKFSSGDAAVDAWMNTLTKTRHEFAKSMGSPAYADLLRLHEYMQSDEDVAESEWRIIRPHSFRWSEGSNIDDVKRSCLNMALSGIVPTFRLDPAFVEYIVCPEGELVSLRAQLTGGWGGVRIRTH